MRHAFRFVLAGLILVAATTVKAVEIGATVGILDVAKPGEGSAGAHLLTDFGLEFTLAGPVRLGAMYSRIDTPWNPYGISFDAEHRIIAGFVLLEFLPVSPASPYLRLGVGSYRQTLTDPSGVFETYKPDGTVGAMVGLGGRAYLLRFASASMELQYHYTDLGTDEGFQSRDAMTRLVFSAELWWSPGGGGE